MAQRVSIELVDDIDGSPAAETVSFALDGVTYELDLSATHAASFREALGHYIGHARKVGGANRRGGTSSRRSSGSGEARVIREWARSNGYTVPDRGRVSADVKAAYDAATK